MWRAITNWALNTSLIFILFGAEIGTTWFDNQIKASILVILGILIPGIISLLTHNYKRQLTLTVRQKNKITGKNCTQYYKGNTGQKARIIDLEVNLKRRKGLNLFVSQFLKGKNLMIHIECNPPGLELQAKDEELLNEITPKPDRSGFFIDISHYIKAIAEHKTSAEPSKIYPFFIKETKDSKHYFNSNMKCYINPVLMTSDGKKAPVWLLFALSWQSDQHEIEYYHEEER